MLGHDVRLIPPIYVKPCVKRGKSDTIDAEAICEAVTRPTMSHPVSDACIAERSLCCNKDWLCWYDDLLKHVAKEDARVCLLRTIVGGGAVIASGIIASIGDGHQFSNTREGQ
jgi:hypothetical protein